MVGTSPRPPSMEENCGESQDSARVVALIKKKKKNFGTFCKCRRRVAVGMVGRRTATRVGAYPAWTVQPQKKKQT